MFPSLRSAVSLLLRASGRPARRLSGCLLLGLAACGEGLVGPAAESCGPGPHFTAIPVAPGDLVLIAAYGGLGAPGHTLPTPHTGFMLGTEGAPVVSPGALQITALRRTQYLVSPNRQGREDYTADFRVCKEISGWFGHLTSLAPTIPQSQVNWKECNRYSTAEETVETCRASLSEVTLAAGEALGTGGMSIALGLMGLDFGLIDTRVDNGYVAQWRYSRETRHAICPWDQFEVGLQTQLYAKLRDGGRPWVTPGGEPRCGAMAVDLAGTARGAWAPPTATNPVQGNETAYLALANYPYRPQDSLALSLGPTALGARVAVVGRETSGRVNRAFEQVSADGQIHCYGPDPLLPGSSWLLALTSPTRLSIRKVDHTPGASPCQGDPATWSLAGAMELVR